MFKFVIICLIIFCTTAFSQEKIEDLDVNLKNDIVDLYDSSNSNKLIIDLLTSMQLQIDSLIEASNNKTISDKIEMELSKTEFLIFSLDSLLKEVTFHQKLEFEKMNSAILNSSKIFQKNISNNSMQLLELEKAIKSLRDNIDSTNIILSSSRNGINNKIDSIENGINKYSNYFIIISILFIVTLILILWKIINTISKSGNNISSEIKLVCNKFEMEAMHFKTELIGMFNNNPNLQSANSEEISHDLPIKLGEEIFRMRKRLISMNESQDVKVLNKRIDLLEDKLIEMGYTIVNLEGKKYYEGMALNANFIADKRLIEGDKIITRVITPQINYKNVLLKQSDVEVSQG